MSLLRALLAIYQNLCGASFCVVTDSLVLLASASLVDPRSSKASRDQNASVKIFNLSKLDLRIGRFILLIQMNEVIHATIWIT